MNDEKINKMLEQWAEESECEKRGKSLQKAMTGLRANPIVNYEVGTALDKIKVARYNKPFEPARELYQTRNIVGDNRLIGKCWQMSQFLAALLKDNDRVVRGVLHRGLRYHGFGGYEHGWVELDRGFWGEFVFDPAFGMLGKKSDYYEAFGPRTNARVEAVRVKQALLELWENGERDESGFVTTQKSWEKKDALYGSDCRFRMDVKRDSIRKIELEV